MRIWQSQFYTHDQAFHSSYCEVGPKLQINGVTPWQPVNGRLPSGLMWQYVPRKNTLTVMYPFIWDRGVCVTQLMSPWKKQGCILRIWMPWHWMDKKIYWLWAHGIFIALGISWYISCNKPSVNCCWQCHLIDRFTWKYRVTIILKIGL